MKFKENQNKSLIDSKGYLRIAWVLIGVGSLITIFYLVILFTNDWTFWNGDIDIEKTGAFGDYIGGFVGTIFSVSGFIFLFLTLKEQRIAFKQERFESKFFELLRIHRENVSEMKYRKFDEVNDKTAEDRKVFRIIFDEFLECLHEVRGYSNSINPDDYYKPGYKSEIEKIIKANNLNVDLIELATINIAHCIIFFGVGKEGGITLKHLFQKKYNDLYYHRVIKYLQHKPKRENKSQYVKWKKLMSLSTQERKSILDELYSFRIEKMETQLSDSAKEYNPATEMKKYYGGHQHRLGHYYRHLFQTYKFLNNNSDLNWNEKYFYGKTLRAQLSTYEQALLLVNSISCLGMKWELTPEIYQDKELSEEEFKYQLEKNKLITNYNLIKNLPGNRLLGIKYRDYYPKVKYENDEIVTFKKVKN